VSPADQTSRRPDRATVLAEFLLSDEARRLRDADAVLAACVSRWPDLKRDEFERGFQIAMELAAASLAERGSQVDDGARTHG